MPAQCLSLVRLINDFTFCSNMPGGFEAGIFITLNLKVENGNIQ